jgi:hypothetical protein
MNRLLGEVAVEPADPFVAGSREDQHFVIWIISGPSASHPSNSL